MGTARLSAAEIVNELRSALTEGGWLPAATRAGGPGVLSSGAGLADIAAALREYSRVTSLPATAVRELERAAGAASAAQRLAQTAGADQELYGELGSALAYLVQARRSLDEHGREQP